MKDRSRKKVRAMAPATHFIDQTPHLKNVYLMLHKRFRARWDSSSVCHRSVLQWFVLTKSTKILTIATRNIIDSNNDDMVYFILRESFNLYNRTTDRSVRPNSLVSIFSNHVNNCKILLQKILNYFCYAFGEISSA